jgi:hypothetical protein
MRRLKLMTGLSTLAVASALALAGCGGEGEAEGGEGEAGAAAVSGESEGGEGESEGGVVAGDPATDDVAYIRLLGLVRGHLVAFYELYRAGDRDMAMMHVKHPESELYASLTPAFAARGKPGFADELRALAAAAEGGDIDGAYNAAVEAINAHLPAAKPASQILAISAMVRTAADEFDIGVEDDGVIVNAHEYQDAYGFLVAARDMLAGLDASDVDVAEAVGQAHEQIEASLASFDGLVAVQTEGKASALYGAAARIEIAARGLT